eukprot:NODE_5969_length_540_cov_214.628866.p2 GENE.NODE_5969_length_540_cov_214.628866~~NODE_5969_length_540_cov_214.628866.p2  ORF type:complete len:120 (+),score=36.87 NODE_5969_length_540_cov_214.628866:63-422(+)
MSSSSSLAASAARVALLLMLVVSPPTAATAGHPRPGRRSHAQTAMVHMSVDMDDGICELADLPGLFGDDSSGSLDSLLSRGRGEEDIDDVAMFLQTSSSVHIRGRQTPSPADGVEEEDM